MPRRKIYIRCEYTDMRKQINGLVDIIQYNFKFNPYSNSIFLFCGRRADRSKAVHYKGDTFAKQLLNKGASIRGVQELLGHKSIVTIQIYTEIFLYREKFFTM